MSTKKKTKSARKKRKKRLRKKTQSTGGVKSASNMSETIDLEDHTLILCGLHAECRKLSNLIGVMAKGYVEGEGES